MRHQDNTGKFIAFILRHHPESIGMNVDGHGWARTEDDCRDSEEQTI